MLCLMMVVMVALAAVQVPEEELSTALQLVEAHMLQQVFVGLNKAPDSSNVRNFSASLNSKR